MSCLSPHHSLLKHLSAAVPHWLCGGSEEMFIQILIIWQSSDCNWIPQSQEKSDLTASSTLCYCLRCILLHHLPPHQKTNAVMSTEHGDAPRQGTHKENHLQGAVG